MISRIADAEVISTSAAREVRVLLDLPDVSMTWSRYEPGQQGPGLHVHREHTDCFYVLEGELTFGVGVEGEKLRAPAGEFVAAPAGLAHSFANESGAVTSWLNIHASDAGFVAYMRALRDGRRAAFDSHDVPEDGGLPSDAVIHAPAGGGERLRHRNRIADVKCAVPDLSVFEFCVDGPLPGPGPHEHDDHVDSFFVLDGELHVTVEGAPSAVNPGTLAAAPRDTQHSFTHRHDGVVRFLNIHAPDAGFADFLRDVSG